MGIAIEIAPPVLPVYVQPAMPDMGYVWTPGYWAYGPVGYYWVPGTWIQPPMVGVLWTPPYWGWGVGGYLFHAGYWGQHVGYYGGVNYGYGYGGNGYEGGRWEGNNFAYNRSVNNFGTFHANNTYDQPVSIVNRSNVSYNGGTGGLRTEPTAADRVAEREQHVPVTAQQTAHVTASASNPALAASHNGGHPAIAATARPISAETSAATRPAPRAPPRAPPCPRRVRLNTPRQQQRHIPPLRMRPHARRRQRMCTRRRRIRLNARQRRRVLRPRMPPRLSSTRPRMRQRNMRRLRNMQHPRMRRRSNDRKIVLLGDARGAAGHAAIPPP